MSIKSDKWIRRGESRSAPARARDAGVKQLLQDKFSINPAFLRPSLDSFHCSLGQGLFIMLSK